MPSLPAATEPATRHLEKMMAIVGVACLAALTGRVVQLINFGSVDAGSQFARAARLPVSVVLGAILPYYYGCGWQTELRQPEIVHALIDTTALVVLTSRHHSPETRHRILSRPPARCFGNRSFSTRLMQFQMRPFTGAVSSVGVTTLRLAALLKQHIGRMLAGRICVGGAWRSAAAESPAQIMLVPA